MRARAARPLRRASTAASPSAAAVLRSRSFPPPPAGSDGGHLSRPPSPSRSPAWHCLRTGRRTGLATGTRVRSTSHRRAPGRSPLQARGPLLLLARAERRARKLGRDAAAARGRHEPGCGGRDRGAHARTRRRLPSARRLDPACPPRSRPRRRGREPRHRSARQPGRRRCGAACAHRPRRDVDRPGGGHPVRSRVSRRSPPAPGRTGCVDRPRQRIGERGHPRGDAAARTRILAPGGGRAGFVAVAVLWGAALLLLPSAAALAAGVRPGPVSRSG